VGTHLATLLRPARSPAPVTPNRDDAQRRQAGAHHRHGAGRETDQQQRARHRADGAASTDTTNSGQHQAPGYLRRLVYALRPPALDELGLLAALRETLRGAAVPVTLTAPDALPALPAAVEVAASIVTEERATALGGAWAAAARHRPRRRDSRRPPGGSGRPVARPRDGGSRRDPRVRRVTGPPGVAAATVTCMEATVPLGQFPAGMRALLGAELASVGEDIIAAIAAEVPAYARPLEGRFGHGERAGVAEALRRFLAIVDGGPQNPADVAASREIYVRLGHGEFHAGRSLDNLLAAYRIGTRVAWRRFADVARLRGGLDAAGLVTLGETLFGYIDGVCAASTEGYALAQSADAGARERMWDRIGELLLSGADPATIEEIAQAGSLRVPDRLAAVLVPARAGARHRPGLPNGCPSATHGPDLWLFVNGDDVRGQRLAGQLAGRSAVIGPVVAWSDAATSAERVRLARQARDDGVLPADPRDGPLFTDDHLAALLLARDPLLLADLTRTRLAPLAGLPERTRQRLAATLLHWLALRGQRALIARHLHIHPQTVRYRLLQLRELFGDALDDPDARFELELVLRAGAAVILSDEGGPDGDGA
jgi:hypothetical protein